MQAGRETASGAPGLSEKEITLLSGVDRALADGEAVMDWWDRADARGEFADRFELVHVPNRPEHSYSFFDVVPLPSGPLPVMGDVPEMLFDRPKGVPLRHWRDEVREFVLRYFMRVSDTQDPVVTASEARPRPRLFPRLSLCPEPEGHPIGFGYEQLYYKRRDTGEIGRFAPGERHAIIDVVDLESIYEWVLVSIHLFHFHLYFPTNPEIPGFNLPLQQTAYGVLSRAFVTDETDPEEGVLGRYSFGYAMIKQTLEQRITAYGPGEFETGFQRFDFTVRDDGDIWVRMPFVVNRASRLVEIPLNPLRWGLATAAFISPGLASRFLAPVESALDRFPWSAPRVSPIFASAAILNFLTGGLAGSRYCFSRVELEKLQLAFHFNQYYGMLTGTLPIWRLIPDWTDTARLPPWVVTGRSS